MRDSNRTRLRLAELLVHLFPQLAARAEQTQAHGNGGNAQAVGYFLRRIVQHILQKTCLPEIRGQLHDGAGEKRAHFLARQALFGIVFARGNAAADGFFRGISRLLERDDFALAAPADYVDGGVRADARNPGMKIVTGFAARSRELVQARDGAKQRFLAHVFGIAGVAGHAQCGEKKARGIGRHKPRKGFAIAAPRGGEKIWSGLDGLGGGTSFQAVWRSVVVFAAETDHRSVHLKAEGSSAHGRSRRAGEPPPGFSL